MIVKAGLLLGCTILSALPAQARIISMQVLKTEPAFGGQSFGTVGRYDHLTARVEGVLDPADRRNAIIQDIALAPKDAQGMVHYTTDVELLKPADPARGNGTLMFEVNNRGNKLALGAFNDAVAGNTEARNGLTSPGDGWLMQQGYTVIWWGWQMDVKPGWNRILMPEIVAHQADGSPVTGIVRAEMETPGPVNSMSFTRSQQVMGPPADSYDGYPTAQQDNKAAFPDGFLPTLTVRAREQDPRVTIPATAWHFGTCEDGKDAKHVCLADGFKPGRLYELIYRAQDPTVQGIGFAASRDLGAFLTHAKADDAGTANPIYRDGAHAIIEGTSQSGRMIRSMLALGFNEDERGQRVFEGAYPHIGGGLMPLNVRFGQAYRAWGEQTDHTYPAYEFPFTYGSQTDPLTGRTGGLLDRCTASNTCPKVFHVATVLEMWEGRQSLGFTDPLGRQDFTDPDMVRTYIMASTQHGPASPPLPEPGVGNMCQQQSNPNPQTWTMRALLTAFTAWIKDGTPPPPSSTPTIAGGTLVAPDQVRFPPIPANEYGGVKRPATVTSRVYDTLHPLDFGPEFKPQDESGIITVEPPRVGTASYGILEPQVDQDGNDIGGIRSVFAQVPVGTYTGWNVGRADRFEGGMCNLQGSFIPFAPTKAAREAVGDPRLSIEERYGSAGNNGEAYVSAVRNAAARLVQQRFLLPDDAAHLIDDAQKGGPAAVTGSAAPRG